MRCEQLDGECVHPPDVVPRARFGVRVVQEIPLTTGHQRRTIMLPMARILTAKEQLRGPALSSFGAYACQPGTRLHSELQPGRRDSANTGRPVVCWESGVLLASAAPSPPMTRTTSCAFKPFGLESRWRRGLQN